MKKAEVTKKQAIKHLESLLKDPLPDFERIALVIANKQVLECQLIGGSTSDVISMRVIEIAGKHWVATSQWAIGSFIDQFLEHVGATSAQYFLVHIPMNVYEEEEVNRVFRKRK